MTITCQPKAFISWYNVCHLFFYVAAVFCFLPQMLGYTIFLDPFYAVQLNDLIDSKEIYTALVASIAITTLLLIENILDTIMTCRYAPKSRTESDFITYFEFPKELLVLILAKDLVLMLYILPYQQYDYLPGLIASQDLLFTWSYLYNLVRLGSPVWKFSKVFVIGSLFTIANLIFSWSSMSEQAYYNSDLATFFLVVVCVAFIILVVMVGQWIYYVWNTLNESADMLTYLKIIQASIFLIFFLVYIFVDWVSLFNPSSSQSWNAYGANYLTTMIYLMTGCTAIVSVISGRVSKFGSILFSSVSIRISATYKLLISLILFIFDFPFIFIIENIICS